MTQQLHPDLALLAPLVGTWEGHGHGEYPTIEPFDYREVSTFTHVGKPFLAYTQRTRAVDDGRPLHAETGYLRALGDGRVELVLVHPTGVAELAAGTVEPLDDAAGDGGTGFVVRLGTTTVATTATAKEVTAVERVITVSGDRLHYRVAMAAVGHGMTHHLDAELVRADG